MTDNVRRFLDSIGKPLSFVQPTQDRPVPNGLVSDFDLHIPQELGYQAEEYEARLESVKRDRFRAHSALRQARMRGARRGELVSRQAIIERDDSTCYLCGERCEPSEIHLDHVVPLSKGGHHAPENLRVTHARCNLSKGAKLE